MAHSIWSAALVRTDKHVLICDQRIAVEARLVSILVNVVAPLHFSGPLFVCIEFARA